MSDHAESIDTRLEALNTQYALCFAVILTFTFYVREDPTVSVEPTVPLTTDRLLPIGAALLYFMLDWTNWNLVRRQGLANAVVFAGNMAGIVLLSLVILALYSSDGWRVVAVAGYLVLAASWDIGFQWWRQHRRPETGRPILGLLIAGIRAVLALVLLWLTYAAIHIRPDAQFALNDTFYWLAGVVILLKAARLLTY